MLILNRLILDLIRLVVLLKRMNIYKSSFMNIILVVKINFFNLKKTHRLIYFSVHLFSLFFIICFFVVIFLNLLNVAFVDNDVLVYLFHFLFLCPLFLLLLTFFLHSLYCLLLFHSFFLLKVSLFIFFINLVVFYLLLLFLYLDFFLFLLLFLLLFLIAFSSFPVVVMNPFYCETVVLIVLVGLVFSIVLVSSLSVLPFLLVFVS
mmetsp:Transcript_8600/g.12678  ORF Transcript_8600/g.12678 Transcript_8600/m.12678 type:complete len:205 (+) Transcript_8600:670-1284(+)